MDAGRDLTAAMDGTVIATNDGEYDRCSTGDCDGGGGYGNYVMIQHPDGKVTVYGHMRQWTVAVAEGDYITCGTFLGQVGSSGHSTGPHVHFEVRDPDSSRVDPFDGDCSYPPSYWADQGEYDGLPALACVQAEPCQPVGVLSCGDVVSTSNDATGHTDTHYYYGCSEFTYSGPELAWSFATNLDESVTVQVSGLSADLDLYLLASQACDASDCLAASTNSNTNDESITFDASAGTSYTLVVDGWDEDGGDAVSDFTLAVLCNGSLPADTAAPPLDSADTGGGGHPQGDSGNPTSPPGSRHDMLEDESCGGCAGSPAGGLPLLGALLGALLVGRRRE